MSDPARAGDGERSGIRVTEEDPESLAGIWANPRSGLVWDCLFVLPPWLEAWRTTLGSGETPMLLTCRQGGDLLGVAPLRVREQEASFLGSPDVCDYQDFVGVAGREVPFLASVLDHLNERGVRRLDLGALRPESLARRALPFAAEAGGWEVSWEHEGVSVELDLPSTWEDFVAGLGKRERHELRRKSRRLDEACEARLRRAEATEQLGEAADAFLELLAGYRQDKAAFLTPKHRAFFRALIEEMGRAGLLDLSFLDVHGQPVAATLCFEHGGVTYLYNNGYDPRFAHLSVGFLAKMWSIRSALERGNRRYDLLKGDEAYKLRLGGRAVPLWRCRLRRN